MTTQDSQQAREFDRRPGYPMSFRRAAKRVRLSVGDVTIVDANRPMVMLEDHHAPVYYFARSDVRMDLLTRTTHSSR